MANSESKFSQIIECVSTEGLEFLEGLLNPQAGNYIDMDGEEHIDMEPCEFERKTYKSLWIHDFEGGGVSDRLIDAIKQYQIKFNDPKPISIEWGNTCDEPIVGDFGCGAIVIYKGKSHWITTSFSVANKISDLIN